MDHTNIQMYPRLSDLINDLFGTHLLLPAKTFGFFLALAFLAAFVVLRRELQRKEQLGHFRLRKEKNQVDGPLPIAPAIFQVLVWGLLGYKFGYMLVDAEEFSRDTEGVLLSGKGYWLTGLVALAIAGGLKYSEYNRRKSIKPKFEEIWAGPDYYSGTVVTIAFVAGIVGSKLFAMLEPGSNFWQDPIRDLTSFNGLSFYGGLLLAGALIIRYLYVRGFGVLRAVDAFVPCLILAYSIGRIGCQMSGDGDWGLVNELPQPGWLSWLPQWTWSYTYPHNVAGEGVPISGCMDDFCNVLPKPVWPTPLYETLMGLVIFGILMWLRTRMKHPGQLTGIYLALIGLERISIEQIRVNTTYSFGGLAFTQAELISVLLIATGIAVWVGSMRKKDALVIAQQAQHAQAKPN